MSDIEWTDYVWNFLFGCSPKSSGCRFCYAEVFAHRGLHPSHKGLTTLVKGRPRWTGEVRLVEANLDRPLKITKPAKWFVNSMSDFFHEAVTFDMVARAWEVMKATPHHVYQILTKRPENIKKLLPPDFSAENYPNVWLGVSVESQLFADQRIPVLLEVPAAVRFLSCEPLIGKVNLTHYLQLTEDNQYDPDKGGWGYDAWSGGFVLDGDGDVYDPKPGIHWVIVGGESGRGARPMHPAWVRQIRDQCQSAGVAFFFKQWGNWIPEPPMAFDEHGINLPYQERDPHFPEIDWNKKVQWGTLTLEGKYFNLTTPFRSDPTEACMFNLGKKITGRWLDGKVWDEMPL